MTKPLIFTIPGRPKPQKQTVHGKGFHWDPSKKDADWVRWIVSEQAKNDVSLPATGPIYVKAIFTFKPPKTSTKRTEAMLSGKIHHTKRPDASNLFYLVENALKGLVYQDDSQICHIEVLKIYGEKEGTLLLIQQLEESA